MTDKFEAMKAAALAATLGPWSAFSYHDGRFGIGGDDHQIMVCEHISKDRKQDAVFIAAASPDVVISLLAALEEKDRQLARYSISPGQADQRLCESRAVREILGFPADSAEVSPADLKGAIEVLKESITERNELIAELEQRLQQPIAIPAGFRIVPIKATREQLAAVQVAGKSVVYTDMVLAAPEHPGFKVEGE